MTRARVLLADDHAMVLDAFAKLLSQDYDIVGTVNDGRAAVARASELKPDVVVLDISMPVLNGLDAARRILQEREATRIVFITMNEDPAIAAEAFAAGASAYLFKHTLSDDLIRVIREVYAGEHQVLDSVAARLAGQAGHPPLTPRELEVVNLMAQAMRNKEIAAALGVSEQTALVHVKNIFSKLGVANRVAAINTARRFGLIGAS